MPPGGRASYVVRSVSSNKKEATDALKAIRKAILTGVYHPPAPPPEPPRAVPTVLDALDGYIRAEAGEGRSAKTLESYGGVRRRVAESPLGSRPVTEVTPGDVEAYMAWRRERVYRTSREKGKQYEEPPVVSRREGSTPSNSTLNKDLMVLSCSFNRLVRHRELKENPVARVHRPKESKRARVALSNEEARNLVAACSPRFRPLVLAALLTGARRGELLLLRWGDINFDTASISIVRPKAGNASTLPLHPVLADALWRLREERGKVEEREVPDTEAVFTWRKGRPYGNIRKAWEAAVKAAGLEGKPGVCFHSLRHYPDTLIIPTRTAA